MKSIFFTTALLAASASALAMTTKERTELLKELDAWKKSHAGKAAKLEGLLPPKPRQESAHDQREAELKRFAHTKKVVAELNKNHHGSAVFSTDNPFALMTDAEFKKFVKGAFTKPHTKRQLRAESIQLELTPAQREATGKDWTSSQSVGAAEMAHCIVTGKLLDLSEQQLVSCATSAGQGCKGGFPSKAHCANRRVLVVRLPSCKKNKLSVGGPVDIQGESALQSALDKQPVTVVVEATNDVWRNYKSGIVESCPGGQSDHAVIAVGYGSNFFTIRNSWGTSWGEQGYMRLKKGAGGNGMCNVAEAPSYPSMSGGPQPDDPSDGPTDDPSDGPTDDPSDFPSDVPSDDPWNGDDDNGWRA
ncbi:hypothetical protein SDRG_01747 [Saprolegnia diclina VS20]|uniref:Peptidase C1A papain C-terminal domain-containing protein n=1 Tax=Saprolegnia diclina (strain VS20) TaxID=1156394 RepID=T0QRB0_SAPDV|nr:hypothetical protein SDRG_01747 [Saprolegnia diclina VS20]EQC40669.1 hypothetical protein SDRG_01747 [Saprolegnia diclina VS20]|eukprot:XP_008605513.1 hypothetical protein SDRG_01747 [Saprolegnia diclina VS20]